MRIAAKKPREKEPDDSLFGLLAAYKANNTYFRILVNEEKKLLNFTMTDNPKFFVTVEGNDALEGYRMLSRTEMNLLKLSVKYISPQHILEFYGETLGIKISPRSWKITNTLNSAKRIYTIETRLSNSQIIVQTLRKIIHLTPQKKYEIIEKYLANRMKSEVQE